MTDDVRATGRPAGPRHAAPEPPPGRGPVAGGASVLLLAVTALLVVGQLYVTIPLPSFLAASFPGAPVSAWPGTAFGLAYAAGFLVFGPLSDRHGRVAVIVPGLVALAVATAAVPLAPGLPALLALRAAQGLAASTFAPAALAHLGETLPPHRRAGGIAWVSAALLFAALAGQIYGQQVAGALGWRACFWLVAPAFPVLALLVRRLPRPAAAGRRAETGAVYAAMLGLLRRPRLLVLYATTLTVLGGFVAVSTTLALHPEQIGAGPDDLPLLRLVAVPAMLLAPLSGRWVTRRGPVPVATAGLLAAAAGAALLAAAGSPVTGGVALVVFTAGVAVASSSLIGFVVSLAPDARGAATALQGCALFLGAGLGPLAAVAAAPPIAGLLVPVAAVLLAAAGALFPLRERPARPAGR